MKRLAWLLLVFVACTTTRSQDTVTVVAPPATKQCPPDTVFNGVECAELLAHSGPIDSGVAPVVSPERPNLNDEARDLRALSKTPRAVQLLVVEAQALEQLKNATPSSAPDYPQLVRRLAEDYSELAYAFSVARDAKGAVAARKQVITEYSLLVAQFPQYAQLDEVLYYLGYTYELDGDLQSARKTYYQLIQKFPQSKWIPYAYYSFGEAFAAEAKSDPTKWQLATQAYQETAKFANSNILPWAFLRLGQSLDAQGDHARATQMYAKLKATYPGHKAASEIP